MTYENSFFIYGSFCEGMAQYGKIKNYVTQCVPALAKGSAYRLSVGYPVYLTQGDHMIEGNLVQISASDLLFKLLDEFHGYSALDESKGLYLKPKIQVVLNDGQVVETFAYALNPDKLPLQAKLIENGNWRESLQQAPAVPDLLTERQATYIRKLGASSGRDIVPIDLQLYRELIKLDLIIDKGRRLALTQLGRDVYRYLV